MEEFNITRLGHRGNGITQNGYYAPMTLPGEVIRARYNGKSLNDINVIERSSYRIQPPCIHFKTCGGCQLQHASDEFISRWKVSIVKQSLAAHGISTVLHECVTSPVGSRRRATFSARRTKKGAMVGFHARSSKIIGDVSNCRLIRKTFSPPCPSLRL